MTRNKVQETRVASVVDRRVERVLPYGRYAGRWGRDSNPHRRLCRPLPRHSATPTLARRSAPYTRQELGRRARALNRRGESGRPNGDSGSAEIRLSWQVGSDAGFGIDNWRVLQFFSARRFGLRGRGLSAPTQDG